MPHLILKDDDSQAKIFKVTKSVTTIGRRSGGDVYLADMSVSRDHAEIIAQEDGGFEIQDLGAKQPTRVNGKIISKYRLKDGDEIELGQSKLIFKYEDTCDTAHVEFLAAEDMIQETVEVTSLDARKTLPFSAKDLAAKDLISLQKDHQRLMLLYELGKTMNSHLEDLHHLLEEIMNTAFKTLNAERGFIALVDEKTGELTCDLVRDYAGDQEPTKLEVSRTIVHKVVHDGVSVLTVNALKDSQLGKVKSVQEYNIRSAICAPLLSRGEVLGVVYLDNRTTEGSFSEDDLMFLMAMCHQAGIAMGNARLHSQVAQENIRLGNALKEKFQLVGNSDEMKKVFSTMKKIAPSDITILIQGETGTGKELIARAIHEISPRRAKPYIPVNCAAIPKDLIESELFGHEKGAFTGAISTRDGKFKLAHGGTVFLDEIGDMSLETQSKVLRILEEKELQRVGGTKTFTVDVRVVAATNKDLWKAVEEGKFREDLYYRLNVVSLELPPLRERKIDIIPLVEFFMAGRAKKISPNAKQLLLSYDWPGNVRELKNCIDRAVVMGDGKIIQPEDLPHNIRKGGKVIPSPLESLDDMEEDHITRVLRYTNWNKSEAVRMLGITRQTLDNKIKKYNIKRWNKSGHF